MAVSLAEYKKALVALDLGIEFSKSRTIENEFKIARDAVIQRFEFCVELAWKVAGKIIGSSSVTPNSVIREMAQNNLIEDTKTWFDFIEARNKTSHSYNEDIAKIVYLAAIGFYPLGLDLFKKLTEIEIK